ncbi:hypothetical protein Pst134EA_011484 [Puccinia striiformis f. sp. tritici]|uniref:hypothetical protein n=1 Tax=Puccinia striiformis f. sp. tritici TaxID=168172 RepID=UPI0020085EE3|nr:hypothetical protein Pst134EA_011484 [Puccinia striiformis f. sp. tritici]KAH9467866.1 hypothetical protein Pst134EA_011484 [Puccinia striiformis f. sp. tritici]
MKLCFYQVRAIQLLSCAVVGIVANPRLTEETSRIERNGLQMFDLNELPDEEGPADDRAPRWLKGPASPTPSGSEFTAQDAQASSLSPIATQAPIPLEHTRCSGSHNREELWFSSLEAKESESEAGRLPPKKRKHRPDRGVAGTPLSKTSRRPEKSTRVDKQMAIDKKIPINSHESIDEDVSVLDTQREKMALFSVKDWDFARLEESKIKTGDNDSYQIIPDRFRPERFFNLLNSWTISKRKLKNPSTSQERKSELRFPEGEGTSPRKWAMFYTIHNLSNEKIDFDSYPIYSEDIIQRIESSLVNKSAASSISPMPRDSIDSLMVIVKEVTKTASFLIIIYMRLFGELEHENLTSDVMEGILSSLAILWTDLQSASPKKINHEEDWVKGILGMLSTGKSYNALQDRKIDSIVGLKSRAAWGFLETWIKTSDQKIHMDHHEQVLDLKVKQKRYFGKYLDELIKKIIYCLNYQSVQKMLQRNSDRRHGRL